jgi:hypothetical protein
MDRSQRQQPQPQTPGRSGEDSAPTAPKKPWERPVIRASAHCDKQALACSMADQGPPFCNGGSSSG